MVVGIVNQQLFGQLLELPRLPRNPDPSLDVPDPSLDVPDPSLDVPDPSLDVPVLLLDADSSLDAGPPLWTRPRRTGHQLPVSSMMPLFV